MIKKIFNIIFHKLLLIPSVFIFIFMLYEYESSLRDTILVFSVLYIILSLTYNLTILTKNYKIHKIDYTYILFTLYFIVHITLIINSSNFYDYDALMLIGTFVWISMYIYIYFFLFTTLVRLINKSFKQNFSLYKFLYSKHISTTKKVVIAIIIFILIFCLFNTELNGYFARNSYKFFNKIAYASVVYALIYYITFYVEMLNVIYEEDDEFMLNEVKEYSNNIKQLNAMYSQSVQDQLKAERMKSDLITNVSHDIRTPLTSIISYVDLLSKKNTLDKQALSYLDILTKKSWRLNNLIDDLMDATKLSSGNTQVCLEKLDLLELIVQVEADFEDRLDKCNLEIIYDFHQENAFIYADSNSTSRVLENIYSNIIKYSMPNTRVYISTVVFDEQVKLIFKNISLDKLNIDPNELLERFVRAEESRSIQGNGLGLYIAQSLMELMQGSLVLNINGDLFINDLTFKKSMQID